VLFNQKFKQYLKSDRLHVPVTQLHSILLKVRPGPALGKSINPAY